MEVYFFQAGNGICHQVHLEFMILVDSISSDSHTPVGVSRMLAGAGGLM